MAINDIRNYFGLSLVENPVVPAGDVWWWTSGGLDVHVFGDGVTRFRALKPMPYDPSPHTPRRIWVGTEAELALIDPQDPLTLYVVVE